MSKEQQHPLHPMTKKPFELPVNINDLKEITKHEYVWEMKKCGWTDRQIAYTLDMKVGDVKKVFRKWLRKSAKSIASSVKDLVYLEYERTEDLIGFLWPRAEQGNPRAIEVLRSLLDYRAKLMGFNAPEKKEVKVDAQLEQMSEEELIQRAMDLKIDITSIPSPHDPLPGEEEGPIPQKTLPSPPTFPEEYPES